MQQASNPDGRVRYPPVGDNETCAQIIDSLTKTICGQPAAGYVTLISGQSSTRARVPMCDRHKSAHNDVFAARRRPSA